MIIYIKMDLALNNPQGLICHKPNKPNQTKPNLYICIYIYIYMNIERLKSIEIYCIHPKLAQKTLLKFPPAYIISIWIFVIFYSLSLSLSLSLPLSLSLSRYIYIYMIISSLSSWTFIEIDHRSESTKFYKSPLESFF